MGILDWFKHRAGRFDTDRVSEEMVRWAVDKAITLTNPRLKVLPNCHKRLASSVETTIRFLQGLVRLLPAVRRMSTGTWSADAALRAFFVSPSDMKDVLARAEGLRTLFEKFPELEEAYLVLGMAFTEQRIFGLGMQGDIVQRDVAQLTVNFPTTRHGCVAPMKRSCAASSGSRFSNISFHGPCRRLAQNAASARNCRRTGR